VKAAKGCWKEKKDTYKEGPMNTPTFAAFVIGLTAAGFASAQSVSLRATVPFSFVVGSETLPAGEYTISAEASLGTMIIQGTDIAKVSLTIPSVDQNSAKTARLVFRAYGDRYFLAQVWGDGKNGSELLLTRTERELTAHKHNPSPVVPTLREIVLHK
jgi:hypothetical protein